MSIGYGIWLICSVTVIAYGIYGLVSGEIYCTIRHCLRIVLRSESPLDYWISILGYISGGTVSGLILMKSLASDKKIREFRRNQSKQRRSGDGNYE